MHPTMLRVMVGVERAGITWARIYRKKRGKIKEEKNREFSKMLKL